MLRVVFIGLLIVCCGATATGGEVVYLKQPVIITTSNPITLPVGTAVRVVAASNDGNTWRVTADGVTMFDLNRSLMSEHPVINPAATPMPAHKTKADTLHKETLEAEIKALREEKQQLMREFSEALHAAWQMNLSGGQIPAVAAAGKIRDKANALEPVIKAKERELDALNHRP